MSMDQEFDPSADLPTGTMVLEASAGTGKTHAIVSIAVRYLADGEIRFVITNPEVLWGEEGLPTQAPEKP